MNHDRFMLPQIFRWFCILSYGISASHGSADNISFNRDIRPILVDHCWECHGPDAAQRKADLRLDTRSGILDKVGIPGDSEKSKLIEKILSNDPDEIMPPPENKNPLTEDQKRTLKGWIDQGMPWQDHWAWTAPRKSLLDQYHSIDGIMEKSLKRHDLSLSSQASPRNLVRRLSLDMLGLPPDPEVVEEFTKNPSDDAYQKLVETFIQDPAFGERLAVPWLDLVRYADSNGYHADLEWSVWPYRDYVIRAFNANMPFDQFTREQIAGDLLPNATMNQKVAAGYNRLNMKSTEFGIQDKEYLAKYAADRVRTTSATWLGSTLGCAECHDHKYDPFSTKDFYSFAAFFADIKSRGYYPNAQNVGWGETIKVIDEHTQSEIQDLRSKLITKPEIFPDARSGSEKWNYTFQKPGPAWFQTGFDISDWKSGEAGFGSKDTPNARIRTEWKGSNIWLRKSFELNTIPENIAINVQHDEDASIYINAKLVSQLKGYSTGTSEYSQVIVPKNHLQQGSNLIAIHCRQTSGGQFIDAGVSIYSEEQESINERIKNIQDSIPTMLATVSTAPRITRILPRGNWMDESGEIVSPSSPTFLGNPTSGSRLDLANWLVHQDNPLTARVFVNRLWKIYFGSGLSNVLDDLGTRGEWPNHQELLDWLALEFMHSGWDIKHVVRLIVLSDSYKQSSFPKNDLVLRDPQNRLFARQSRFRLEAEFIRDQALKASGLLHHEIGGPSIKPYQPDGYWDNLYFPRRVYKHNEDHGQFRRGLYIHWQRQFLHPALLAFDAPSREECVAERPKSNTPTGALVLLNDPSYVEAAKVLAFNATRHSENEIERLNWMYRCVLSRPPKKTEIKFLLQLIEKHQMEYSKNPEDAHKFIRNGVYKIDDDLDQSNLAAWTSAARVLLNLHESITRY